MRRLLLRNGFLSAAIYGGLAFAFPLAGNWHRLLVWRDLTGSALIGFIMIAAAGLALFGLYWQAWMACRATALEGSHRLILAFSVLFAVLLVGMYPVSSNDVYTYFLYGRVLAFNHENPFVADVGRLANDSLNAYITPWVDSPSPYGPLWAIVSSGASWLVGFRILWGLLFFKALAVLALAASVLLVDRLLLHAMPERRESGLLLFAWSPLLLFESVANAHNDVVPLAFALAAFWLVVARRAVVVSAGAFAVSLLFKPSPLLLAPIYLVLLRDLMKRDSTASACRALLSVAVSLVLVGAAYAPFGGVVRASQGVLEQGTVFTVSFPAFLRWSSQAIGLAPEKWQLLGALCALFLATYAWMLRRAAYEWRSLAAVGCAAYFLFLALVWPQFHPWYLVWPLALAPFAAEPTLAMRLVLFSALAVLGFSFGHAWPFGEAGWQGGAPALGALAIFLPPLLLPAAWIRRILGPPDHQRLHPV